MIEPITTSITMTCPVMSATLDYVICDITLTTGTDLKGVIDYGDGTTQNFSFIGIKLLSIRTTILFR